MINLDSITNEHNEEHSEKSDHPYRIMIIDGSGSGKTNALLNLINEHNNIDKIYLYAKDLSEPMYEFLIKKRENIGKKHLNDSNAFLSVQIRCLTFMRILMVITQSEKVKN